MKNWLRKIRQNNPQPLNKQPSWLLGLYFMFLFVVSLWLSQTVPIGLEFMKIANDQTVIWNLPTIKSFVSITLVFFIIGSIALLAATFSAACMSILIDRAKSYPTRS